MKSFMMAPRLLIVAMAMTVLWLGATSPLTAQDFAAFAGIQQGSLFHPGSHSIRPIVGFIGSAHLGDPIFGNLDFGSVSPDGRLALLAEGNLLSLGRLNDPPSRTPLTDAIGGVDRILWSRNSSAALLYSSSDRRLQWLNTLNTSPSVEDPIDLSDVPGKVTVLALDPNGRRALIGSFDSDTPGGVYLIARGDRPQYLGPVGNPVAAVFGGGGDLLYVADAQSLQISEIRFANGVWIPTVIDGMQDAIDPVAIALSSDEKSLYLASRSDRTLLVYRVEDPTEISHLDLDFSPSGLDAIPGLAFVMNASPSSGEPFSLLLTQQHPQVLFVPTGD